MSDLDVLYLADIRFPLERANGIQTFATCHALAARGHRVTLVVRPDTARPARDPFEFYGLPREPRLVVQALRVPASLKVRRAAWLARALWRAAASRRAHVVMTRDLGLASLVIGLPASLRAPVVYESHGFAPTVGASLDEMLSNAAPASYRKQLRLARREARVWARAEGYVAITRGLAGELTAEFGARERLAVVPDGVQLANAPTSNGIQRAPGAAGVERERTLPGDDLAGARLQPPRDREPVVGYAGHLYPWKGVDVLLQAVARLSGVRAVIVGGLDGEPDLERTRQLAAALGIGDRVTFTGAVEPPRVPALLADMDVLVLPNTATHVSAKYTSPLKLFEYMAAGRPIVASNLPALREVLADGDNALLVEPGNAEAMAVAVARLLADRSLASRLACAARRDVQGYGWDRRAELLEALFRAVVAGGRS